MNKYMANFLKTIQNKNASEDDLVKAILCLGEIGATKDLSKMQNIMQLMSGLFQHAND